MVALEVREVMASSNKSVLRRKLNCTVMMYTKLMNISLSFIRRRAISTLCTQCALSLLYAEG